MAFTVTFELREGVKFHNEEEMTVEDVVASMEKWAEESSQAKSFLEGVTFEADGDYTVIATLTRIGGIDMFIFADLTQIAAIMPKEVVEAGGEEGITEFIGTGPYQFVEWKQDQYVHIDKFDDYQGLDEASDGLTGEKAAYTDEMYFHFVTDGSTRIAGLQSGEYQIGNFLPQDSADQLKADEDIELSPEINSYPGLVFNNKEGVLNDQTMLRQR